MCVESAEMCLAFVLTTHRRPIGHVEALHRPDRSLSFAGDMEISRTVHARRRAPMGEITTALHFSSAEHQLQRQLRTILTADRMVRKGTWYEQAAAFVEQDLLKLVSIYLTVLLLMLLTPCPPLLLMLCGAGLTALRYQWTGGSYYDDFRIDGKTVIVTGASAGIGYEVAKELYRRGGRIVMACRNRQKAEKVAYEIENSTNANTTDVAIMELDLTSFESVRTFAAEFIEKEPRLDILINNAGIMWHPHAITKDDVEQTFQVNHVSPFLLTNLLLDKLKEAPEGRIINLSSFANNYTSSIDFANLNGEKSWDSAYHYCITKLMNILHVAELARRLDDTRVTAHANCPGSVKTDLISHVNSNGVSKWNKLWYLWTTHKTAFQGAQTTIMLAVDPIYGRLSGRYYADCVEAEPNRLARDPELAKKLWSVTEDLCGKKPVQNGRKQK